MQSGKFLAMVCGVATICAVPAALGDAPCNKGFRDTTLAERASVTAVLTAAKKALPPAPTGWVIRGDDQFFVASSLCRDSEGAPWNLSFNREYQRVDDQEARNKMIADAGAAQAAAFKQKQPRLDANMAKQQKLVQAQVALIQKGDMARATAMNQELAKLQDEYKKILDEGDSDEQAAAKFAEAGRDVTMNMGVRVNSNSEAPGSGATSLPLPAGARAAYRWTTTRDNVEEGHALILVGQWQPAADGSWNRVRRPNVPPTGAQVFSITVHADPNRLASTVQAIDVKSLAAAVAK